ncbi:MAG: nucleotidyltransferase domain-containing protein [Synechococcus lacustris]
MVQAVSPPAKLWAVTDDKLAQVVQRLMADAAPKRLILFGSAARGDLGQANDLDLLVIERTVTSRYHEALRLRRLLGDVLMPIDLLVTSEDLYLERSQMPGTLEYRVAKEGRVLHDAR